MNEELKKALIRFRDLLQIAENVPLDKSAQVWWSISGLNFIVNEAKRLCKYYISIKLKQDNDWKIYRTLSSIYEFLTIDILEFRLKTAKGQELLNLGLVYQSAFWKVTVYHHCSEILKTGFLNLKPTA